MQLCAANFTRKGAIMKGESISEYNEIQKEIIFFLKNKIVSEGKTEFVNGIEMDEFIEEFSLEVKEEKVGFLLDSTKEGVNVNLQEDISFEQQATLKEGENTALSVNGVDNPMIALQSEIDKNTIFDKRNKNVKVTTETVITSQDPTYSDSVTQELCSGK